ncbi:MAG: hypothetical protein Q9165_006180 [Trypethelium subeluteriae]
MFSSLLRALLAITWLLQASAISIGPHQNVRINSRQALQDLVTWDEYSLFVRGERIMFFSGEFHPFRLPVPDLWLDVFQKIKALGFSGVSFYTDWALYEGNRGTVVTDGIWSLEKFFQAASQAGIYLVARPGPYINAETAAGGLPGWTLRFNTTLRSASPEYLNATENYLATLGKIIADAQITNGGPVVLVQPENEYTTWPGANPFPEQQNREVMAFTEDRLRDAGIVVPFIVNDNENMGYWAPGTGLGAVDIYGIDSYPLRYDCADYYVWPTIRGGTNQSNCAILVNAQAERVVYKNNYSFGATIFNIYMIYGGSNWGNLGYHGGDASYDYGAAITEDRLVWREKYPELKLQANFFKVSPAYLTATAGNVGNGSYASTSAIATTPVFGNGSNTNFYVTRHADYTSNDTTTYKLQVPTSVGNLTLPQIGGTLTLFGRDAKIHVTDYDVGGVNMLYSTAEVYTWTRTAANKTLLVLYGGADETHEAAFPASLGRPTISEGSDVIVGSNGSYTILHWTVTPQRRVVEIGSLEIHLLWRNEAYNYWVLELPAAEPIGNFSSMSKDLAVVKAGYLLRSADISGNELRLVGDVNATTSIEVISVPRNPITQISFNGELISSKDSQSGRLTASIPYNPPNISIPTLSALQWRYLDSLPEIQSNYSDALWTSCNQTYSNENRTLTTPTSLYASDYGYHTGSLLFRGHFVPSASNTTTSTTLSLNVTGGVGFAHSVWLNSTFLGSWPGNGGLEYYAQNVSLPSPLVPGTPFTLTVLIDHMGQDEEAPGTDAIKFPRGILDYSIPGIDAHDVTWKMTGNLGGEAYRDLARGPRNEGAMYAERQGYHLPGAPSAGWAVASPMTDGLAKPGVGFYTTTFALDVPVGWDVPMSFVFNGSAEATGADYRCQLFVNGYQFGKYVNNLGPQTVFPVPEGILNHNGMNDVALTLWALDAGGAKLGGLELVPQRVIKSGYSKPGLSPMPGWTLREGAY